MIPLAVLLIAAAGQAAPAAATVEANTKQFLALETRLMGAVQLRTASVLEEMVSPHFGFSLMIEGREPDVLNRSEWLRLTTAHSRLDGFELRSLAAGVFGDHAIVRAQAVRQGGVGSVDLSGEYVLVDLWAREAETWKLRYRVVSRPVAPLAR
jgi:hypothetical protein